MEHLNWKELDELDTLHTLRQLSPIGKDNYHALLQKTEEEEEHPEWYEGACFCQECRSCAD